MEDYSAGYSEDNHEYHENNTNYQEDDDENEENENLNNFCDACERGFATPAQLKFHLQEHRVCGIDGCKFVAHTKIVEKHISMQHVTGLFYRIPQSQKPEDIAKWIAERKKRYPTKENIENRQKEQEEMTNRGERISEPKDRFGRKIKKDTDTSSKKSQRNKKNRFKNKKNKLAHLRKTPPKLKKLTKTDLPSISLLNDKSNWNGKLPPFQGTSDLYESENEVEVEEKFDDSEWLTEEQKETPKIEINNALGALIGAYRSSDESDDELNVPVPKIVTQEVPTPQVVEVTNNEDKKEINDDEAPEEVKIIKEDFSVNQYLDKKKEENGKEDNQKCNRKRKRKHSRDETNSNKKTPVSHLSSQKTNPRKITLLERLLASEIKNERNLILQCIRYVVGNNFFENKVSNSDNITENVCNKENIEMKESFVDSFDKEKNILESKSNDSVNIPIEKDKILGIKNEIDSTNSKNEILDVKNVIVINRDLENETNGSLDKEIKKDDNSFVVKNDISENKNNINKDTNFDNEINESIQKDTILETKTEIQTDNKILEIIHDDNNSISKNDISEIKIDNDKNLEIKLNDFVENNSFSEPKCEIQTENVIIEMKNDDSSITKNDISEIKNNNDTNLENQSVEKNSILEPKNEIQTENAIIEMKNDDSTITKNDISEIKINNATNLENPSILEQKIEIQTENEILEIINDDNTSIAKNDILEIKNDIDNHKNLEIKLNEPVENDLMSKPKCEIQTENVIMEIKNDDSSITKNDISEIKNNNDTNLENQSILESKNEIQTENEILEMKNDDNNSITKNDISEIEHNNDTKSENHSIEKNSILEPKNEIQTENEILEMKNNDNSSVSKNDISEIKNDNHKNLDNELVQNKSISESKNEIINYDTSEITNNVENNESVDTDNVEESIKNRDDEKGESVTSEDNTENL